MDKSSQNVEKILGEADVLTGSGNHEGAAKLYSQALRYDPDNVSLMVRLGESTLLSGRKKAALEIFRVAAYRAAMDGNLLNAIGINKRILAIDPNQQETKQALSRLASRVDPDSARNFRSVFGEIVPDEESIQVTRKTLARHLEADELDSVEYFVDQMAIHASVTDRPESIEAIVDKLPELPLLSALMPEHLEQLIDRLSFETFSPGKSIVREGEKGDVLYIIISGEVSVTRKGPDGVDAEVARMGESEFFGEMAFFSGARRTASVGARTRVETLSINRDDLAVIAARYPEVSQVLHDYYKKRLIGAVLRISPLFSTLDEGEQLGLIKEFSPRTVSFGEFIIREGDSPSGLYVIDTGDVVVTKSEDAGREVIINHLGAGDFFGEISLISNSPATASCIASREVTLFQLDMEAFEKISARYPRMVKVAVETGADRLKRSEEYLHVREEMVEKGLL